MTWNPDEVVTGIAIGGLAGIALGYELRKLVVRFQTWRGKRDKNRITKRDVKRAYAHDKVTKIVQHDELPPVIPIKRSRRSTPKTPVEVPVNPDRDDVIAALMGSGYSKAEATNAADACSMVERSHGLEAWTRAAFTHARKS